jgi:Protein of unknown function (DUF3105)
VANRGGTGTGGRDEPGRATKAERKEQARLERERIQAQMRARHRNRNIGLVLVALALVVVVVAVFAFQPKKPDIPPPATLLGQAKADATTAGCDTPKDPGYYDGVSQPNSPGYDDRTHIGAGSQFPTMPALSTYPSAPPASGPHNPTPLAHGVYDRPPPIDQAIHSLEHAGAIIWYAPGLSGTDLDAINQIKAYYQQSDNVGQSKVIVAPYSYPDQGKAGQLANGVGMALVAWHTLQTCTHPSLAVAFNFTAQYSNVYNPSLYIGQAPEPTLGIDPA